MDERFSPERRDGQEGWISRCSPFVQCLVLAELCRVGQLNGCGSADMLQVGEVLDIAVRLERGSFRSILLSFDAGAYCVVMLLVRHVYIDNYLAQEWSCRSKHHDWLYANVVIPQGKEFSDLVQASSASNFRRFPKRQPWCSHRHHSQSYTQTGNIPSPPSLSFSK